MGFRSRIGLRRTHSRLRERFARELDKRGLDTQALSDVGDSISVLTAGTAGVKKLGVSRFGGNPDLPDALSWPRSEAGLLTFVGQINLSELPRTDLELPHHGWLFFFCEDGVASNIGNRVLFFDGERESLRRLPYPDSEEFSNPEEAEQLELARLKFEVGLSFGQEYGAREPYEEYEAAREAVTPRTERSILMGLGTSWDGDPRRTAHLVMSGHEDILYSYRLSDEVLARRVQEAKPPYKARQQAIWDQVKKFRQIPESVHEAGTAEWRLLFQVSSHSDAGMCWWDAGYLQFYIQHEALLARNFDRTYACVQTS